ncbi:helix-turn-helix domain-containing protein [Methylobacterium sp. D54C]
MTDGNTAPAAQEAPRAHPTIVGKAFWMEKLLADKNLSQSAKLIGVRLALHHNSQTGRCFPTVETLMDGTTNSRATVHRGLTALRKAGYIDWKTGNSKWSNSYELKGVPTRQSGERPASKVSHLRLATSEGMPVSEIEGPTVSPVRPSTVSSVRPQPLKSNPGKGYDEGREKEEKATAPDSPATPFRPDGLKGAQDSAGGEQPDKQPEPVSQPIDGKFTFDQIATPEWIEQRLETAADTESRYASSGRTSNDPSVAKELLQQLRDWSIRAGKRGDEFDWSAMWISFYNQKRPSEPYKPTKGPQI